MVNLDYLNQRAISYRLFFSGLRDEEELLKSINSKNIISVIYDTIVVFDNLSVMVDKTLKYLRISFIIDIG